MEDKVKRFVELSIKFTKKAEDLFNSPNTDITSVSGTLMNYTGAAMNYTGTLSADSSQNFVEKSRSEKMQEQTDGLKLLSDEYDEYLHLQKNLLNYYKSLENLNGK